jgi:predicted dehydrogenase
MTGKKTAARDATRIDTGRREVVQATAAGVLASAVGGIFTGTAGAQPAKSLRWGVVGTGGIAKQMVPMIHMAASAELAAVSSRSMQSAREFASAHNVGKAFDSWREMIGSNGVDAIYVATPTSVREEISIAAAANGKHVLAEKPFTSLVSLQRIVSACYASGVGFMDGTHFVHHPRTANVRDRLPELTGPPWSLNSAFQVDLTDRSNIRYNADLEPLGAVGDLGWYSMRAAVEYLSPDAEPASVDAYIRRDAQTGAAISGSGIVSFGDGSSTTWNCGFDSGALLIDLRIAGPKGAIVMSDFTVNRPDGSAAYTYRKGGFGADGTTETVEIGPSKPAAALMFEDFASMVGDHDRENASILASERTQRLLDAVWTKALENEQRG